MNTEDKMFCIALAIFVTVFVLLLFVSKWISAANYYDCVYNIKSAGLTPTDIKAICEL